MRSALQAVDALSDPASSPNVRPMSGDWAGCYRLRVGSYRAILRVVPPELPVAPQGHAGCPAHRPARRRLYTVAHQVLGKSTAVFREHSELWTARTCPRFAEGGSLLPRAGWSRDGARTRPPRRQVGSRRKARTSPRTPKPPAKTIPPSLHPAVSFHKT